MPGYNHYSWCTCGWCYKHGWNFYSPRTTMEDFDRSFAERRLKETGAIRSWTACFVDPNARCPVCCATVFFYQNERGGRVYFDELGWPWPKHPCTDNSKSPARSIRDHAPQPIAPRAPGAVKEILEAAQLCKFDPNAKFRSHNLGQSPWDLMTVSKTVRVGFENLIEAKSISPPLDESRFVRFSSKTIIPSIGDYFSFNGIAVSVLNYDTFIRKECQARAISKADFDKFESLART